MLAEISQRHGFTKDVLADQWAKGAANDHLDRPSKQLLQIRDQTAWEPRRCLSSHVDEKVHIAFACFFAAGDGTEQAHVPGTMMRRYAQDVFSPLPDLVAEAHAFYFIPLIREPERNWFTVVSLRFAT
jgi:hypothetical protein